MRKTIYYLFDLFSLQIEVQKLHKGCCEHSPVNLGVTVVYYLTTRTQCKAGNKSTIVDSFLKMKENTLSAHLIVLAARLEPKENVASGCLDIQI